MVTNKSIIHKFPDGDEVHTHANQVAIRDIRVAETHSKQSTNELKNFHSFSSDGTKVLHDLETSFNDGSLDILINLLH